MPWSFKRKGVDIFGYIRSSASAKKVQLKGSTIETHEPYGENNITKNNTTESKNNIQYSPVLFLVVSILNNFLQI